jgi:hypothetical protein
MNPETTTILVILLRALVPFLILRWPLIGAILAIVVDATDLMIFEAFGAVFPEGIQYHHFDKIFDIWYLFFEFIVVMTWKDKIARNIAASLFTWRFAGFLTFMLAGVREAFFFAPNIFEFFFLATLIIWKYNPEFKYNWKKAGVVLLIVGIPNMLKEYIMHFKY